jgi:large conductance mechanosensitive channel
METNTNEKIKGKSFGRVAVVGSTVKNQLTGFFDFIRTQGIVGFAVAFILGGAVSALVTSVVVNLVNPVLGVVLGSAKDLAANSVNFFGGHIMYGKFLNDLINFFVIAFVVYFGVKKLGLDKLDKPKN